MLIKIPRKKKKGFKKFIENTQGVVLNPEKNYITAKDVVEGLYFIFRRRHCSKKTFSTKGK